MHLVQTLLYAVNRSVKCLLIILHPTWFRRPERCRSWIGPSINLWDPRWIHCRLYVFEEVVDQPSNLTASKWSSLVELCLLLRWLVSWSFLSGCPPAILNSRFSKSGRGLPVRAAEVMRSSILSAHSTSPIQSIAALVCCEELETALLKLIFQLLNSVGWGHLSIITASLSLFSLSLFWSSTIRDCSCSFCTFNWWRSRRNSRTVYCHWSFRVACWWLGAAANFDAAFIIACSLCKNSWGSSPACGRWLIAGSVILLTDVDVATLPSTQTHWIELRLISSNTLNLTLLTFHLCFKIYGEIWWHSWCSHVHTFAA